MVNSGEIRVKISFDANAINAAGQALELANSLGFSEGDQTKIGIAVLELSRNIVRHAFNRGEVIITPVVEQESVGIIITAIDNGPGIPNVDLVLKGGWSTSNGLGEGIAGVKRMMDEIEIKTATGKGTTIVAKKWKR